jgi:RimJ/RimL family protein N-acetyltransferase
MADEIQLRPATASDSDAMASLLGELGYPTDAIELPARLAGVVAEGGAVYLAVDAGGRPLGLMSLTRHTVLHAPAPVAYIVALVVSGSARRRGIGQRLVAAAMEWARAQGCSRLSVTSAERRTDAHAFYPACGLPYTGRRFATPIAPAPVAELRERLAGWATDFVEARAFRYALIAAEDDTGDSGAGPLLGGADLHPRSPTARAPLADADRVELGYWLAASAEGRGFVLEAARAVLDVAAALPALGHAEARVDPRNARSAAVARRLGFHHAGVEGGLDVWRISMDEWAEARAAHQRR